MCKIFAFVFFPLILFADEPSKLEIKPAPQIGTEIIDQKFAAEVIEKKTPEPVESPEATALMKRMNSLFNDSKNVNHPNKSEGQKARNSIDTSMDWEKAAQLCLGLSEWQKQPKRDEFKKLLHEVVGKTAYSRIDKFWSRGTTHQFLPIEIKADEAHLTVLYTVNNSQFKIEYFMRKKQDKWFIYDIAYEGERYSTNIHDQIEAFLRENSFTVLLEKLRKRLEELESNEPKKQKVKTK